MVAIITGKNLVMDEQKQNQLFIFKKKISYNPNDYDSFELYKRVVLKDIEIFKKVCMKFHFHDQERLMFVKHDMVFALNFEKENIEIHHKFRRVFTE